MDINVNGVTITLTKDQLAEIARQTEKKVTVNEINSYEDACKILSRIPDYTLQSINSRYFAQHVLETIIEAANFIDNDYKKWIADFTTNKEYKYINYWEKNKIGSGWSLHFVGDYCCISYCSVVLYFKKQDTAKLFATRFLGIYNTYLG